MSPEDWQIAAYEAALRQDHDTVVKCLRELREFGRGAIEQALHAWMERTKVAMFTLAEKAAEPVEFGVEGEESEDGRLVIDPEVAWAGQLFASHVAHNHDQWNMLFKAMPDGEDLDSATLTALRILTETAVNVNDAYLAAANDGTTPATRSARIARAHLN